MAIPTGPIELIVRVTRGMPTGLRINRDNELQSPGLVVRKEWNVQVARRSAGMNLNNAGQKLEEKHHLVHLVGTRAGRMVVADKEVEAETPDRSAEETKHPYP